jgi:hypothetical protein
MTASSGAEGVEGQTPLAITTSTANALPSRDAVSKYEAEMGHPPPLDDSAEAWQWAYSGKSLEREKLLEMIQIEAEAEQLSLC